MVRYKGCSKSHRWKSIFNNCWSRWRERLRLTGITRWRCWRSKRRVMVQKVIISKGGIKQKTKTTDERQKMIVSGIWYDTEWTEGSRTNIHPDREVNLKNKENENHARNELTGNPHSGNAVSTWHSWNLCINDRNMPRLRNTARSCTARSLSTCEACNTIGIVSWDPHQTDLVTTEERR